jgi:cell division protein YceG involved in septum cleavage
VTSAKDNGYYDKDSSSQTTTTESTTEKSTSQKASATKNASGKGGTITIVEGMSAYEICELLEEIGIRDADDYYDWLLRSGYSKSLVAGTYTFTGNETNGGIVWILLGHQ